MTADRWSDLLALLAGAMGLFVVARTWPRLPRRTQVARLRHPSAPPPVGVSLDTSSGLAHWRVSTPPGGLTTAVDIVTWKPVGAGDDWRSEPIVDPVTLEPGTSALLPLIVDQPESAHLVVVAWTVKHPGGDVQGSRTLTVGTTSPIAPSAVPSHRNGGWARLIAASLLAGLLVILVLVAGWRFVDGDGDGAAVSAPTGATETLSRPTAATTTSVATSATWPETGSAPTTETAATTVASSAGSTVSTDTRPTTTAGPVSGTVAASTTTAAETSPSTTSSDRRVAIRGRVEGCRFGSACLIASFSAIGFPTEGDYVCEFGDGTRFTFRYAGGGALDACSTAGASPSITIEIDGVRSETITRDTVDGP